MKGSPAFVFLSAILEFCISCFGPHFCQGHRAHLFQNTSKYVNPPANFPLLLVVSESPNMTPLGILDCEILTVADMTCLIYVL